MKAKLRKRNKLFFPQIILIFSVILVDQILKYLTKTVSVCNDGVFLGLNFSLEFLILPLLLLLGYFIYKERQFYFLIGYSLVFAGGLSNLIDRLQFGCVVDYIPLLAISKFNVADASISAGILFILVSTILKKND